MEAGSDPPRTEENIEAGTTTTAAGTSADDVEQPLPPKPEAAAPKGSEAAAPSPAHDAGAAAPASEPEDEEDAPGGASCADLLPVYATVCPAPPPPATCRGCRPSSALRVAPPGVALGRASPPPRP